MKTFRPLVGSVALIAALAGVLTGCHHEISVAGKTYVTKDEDTIEFRADGKAVEKNGDPQFLYPSQRAFLGNTPYTNTTDKDFKLLDGQAAGSTCAYKQDRNQIALTCDDGQTGVFTLDETGALIGPPIGMWRHAIFSHLDPKE